jgi:hypothetical protein
VFESSRPVRPMEDGGPAPALVRQPSAGLLTIQEINRKGRISPLPQAVQGAQPQLHGPAGEPGIKSEFGRMFSGIGSGASGLGVSSPVPSGAHLPFSNAGLGRREDVEPIPLDLAPDPPTKAPRKRSRKTKDDDNKGDDDSTGRLTPVGRAKRPRTHPHHHHHQYVPMTESAIQPQYSFNSSSSHHHHHHAGPERTASPLHQGSTPLKNLKSGTPIPSPTGFMKDFPLTHSHQIPRSSQNGSTSLSSRPVIQSPVILPKPKKTIISQAVLDSVAHKPRKHLGDVVYDPELKPAKLRSLYPKFGYSSTPRPLPMKLIKDNENSTLTVKVPRTHLTREAREEITSRRAIWGTDIYTDDSDVVAACIHAGWIRGEWADDVDQELLDLGTPVVKSKSRNGTAASGAAITALQATPEVLTSPPAGGPVQVPLHRDLHVTVLILPCLEKYGSTTRYGIKSREFGGTYNQRKSVHDGISFMIQAVRWVDGAAPQSRLRGQARRERIRKAMSEVHRAQVVDIGEAKKPATADKQASKNGNADANKENHPVEATTAGVPSEVKSASGKQSLTDEVREHSGEGDDVPPAKGSAEAELPKVS